MPRHGQSEKPSEVLAGIVERVTFHNEENGFCVLRVKARGHRDLVTVVGHAATISAGEWLTVTGEWFNDRNHCAYRKLGPNVMMMQSTQYRHGLNPPMALDFS